MAVSEVSSGGLGSWKVELDPNIPNDVLSKIDYFGQIAITAGRDNPVLLGDSILGTDGARFVGVFTRYDLSQTKKSISGFSNNWWLGDADKKGPFFETELYLNSVSFTAAITAALPMSVTIGGIEALAGLYKGQHQYKTSREILDLIVGQYGAEYYVDNNSSLWAGSLGYLYGTTPKVAIIRRVEGFDLGIRALPGDADLVADVDDFTTRVVMLANGSYGPVVTSTADIAGALNPYKDRFGNALVRVRGIAETDTQDYNATARAQVNLNKFTSPNETLTLDLKTSDIRGDIRAGSYVWVHDEESKLLDPNTRIRFRGEDIYPVKLRVYELTWPIEKGMGVYFRNNINGIWTDLTPYVLFEANSAQVTVGQYDRSLTGVGGGTSPINSKPVPVPGLDSSVPAVITWNTPFATAVYPNPIDGSSLAQVFLSWNQPLNIDGSIITDGANYEIRYARATISGSFPSPTKYPSPTRYPKSPGTVYTQWNYASIGFDFTNYNLQGLNPFTSYGIQIRAVDGANPPHRGDWTATTFFTTPKDNIEPSTPADGEIAASLIAVQILHRLGKASGGTFNLEADLDHLDVHTGTTAGFTPDIVTFTTKLGSIEATNANILSGIPVIKTFNVNVVGQMYYKVIAYDTSGNPSAASAGVPATAQLIDEGHFGILTASKISAGDFTATYGLIGLFRTAVSGARFETGNFGWKTYRASGTLAMWSDSATGNLIGYGTDGTTEMLKYTASTGSINMVGTIETGFVNNRRIKFDGANNEIRFIPNSDESRYGRIYSYTSGSDIEIDFESIRGSSGGNIARLGVLPGTIFMSNNKVPDDGFGWSRVSIDIQGVYLGRYTGAASIFPTYPTTAGGFAELTDDSAHIGYQSAAGVRGYIDIYQGLFKIYGKFPNSPYLNSDEALFVGSQSFVGGSGAGSLAISYGPTMNSYLVPIPSFESSTAQGVGVSSVSLTGFTVNWATTSTGTCVVRWIAMRV